MTPPVKKRLRQLLEQRDTNGITALAADRRRTLGVLTSLTYDADPQIVWRAIEALYRDLFAGHEQAGLLGFSREDIYQYDDLDPEEKARADTAIQIRSERCTVTFGRTATPASAPAV